jgi:hypothetical protein
MRLIKERLGMKKIRWLVYGVTFLICSWMAVHFLSSYTRSEVSGKLLLPITNGELTEIEIKRLLLAISVSPRESLQLSSSDKRAFLVFLQQVCAIQELPSLQNVNIPIDTPVWQILAKNYPDAKALILDPANSQNGKISLKLITKGIHKLHP